MTPGSLYQNKRHSNILALCLSSSVDKWGDCYYTIFWISSDKGSPRLAQANLDCWKAIDYEGQ